MAWINYHGHSNYCDGKEVPEEYVKNAILNKMPVLGISSHSPVPFRSSWNMKAENLKSYLADIKNLKQKYKSTIQVYCGLEVDFIPAISGPSSFPGLDYNIGSIHYIDTFPNGKYWEIDGPHLGFLDGLKEIFNNDIKKAVGRYFELTRQMLTEDVPDILGHLDKIKIQNEEGKLFSESDQWYKDQIEETLRIIKLKDVIVEVNTRGIYKKKSLETYPSAWILKRIYELGIPVLLSSDAHHPGELIELFPKVSQQLLEIGFKTTKIFYNNTWVDTDLFQDGVHLNNTSLI